MGIKRSVLTEGDGQSYPKKGDKVRQKIGREVIVTILGSGLDDLS